MKRSDTSARSPYRGLEPFRYADRDLFFGREAFIEDFLATVLAFRLVVLFGRSGAGKSSLINAGLIPALEREGLAAEKLRIGSGLTAPFVREPIPLTAAESPDYLPSAISANATPDTPSPLSLEQIESVLRQHPKQLGRPVLILDQFEELFTRFAYAAAREEQESLQARLMRWMIRLLKDESVRVKFVIVIREDYFARLQLLATEYPQILDHRVLLQGLDAPPAGAAAKTAHEPYAAERAILGAFIEPNRYPSRISPSLAAEIARDLAASSPDGLVHPTELQIVCARLWDDFSSQALEIDEGHYHALGKLKGIIEGFLTAQLSGLSGTMRAAAIIVLTSLITDEGTRDVVSDARLRRIPELPIPLADVLQELSNRRLILRSEQHGPTFWQITNEYLIPPLQREAHRLEAEARERELRKERRKRRNAWLVAAFALGLAGGIFGLWFYAIQQKKTAEAQTELATSRLAEAVKQKKLAGDRLAALQRVIATFKDPTVREQLARAHLPDPEAFRRSSRN